VDQSIAHLSARVEPVMIVVRYQILRARLVDQGSERGSTTKTCLECRFDGLEALACSVGEVLIGIQADEALCVGWIDGQVRRRDEGSFRQRWTPRRQRSPWSERNVGHVVRLTEQGRMQPAGVAAVDAAKADGRWDLAYAGQATAVLPADLADAVAAEPGAQAMFEVLTSQNRYALIFRLSQVTDPSVRARRIDEFVTMLARGQTPHPQRARPPGT